MRFLSRRFLAAYGLIAVLIGVGAFVWARQGGAATQYRTATATLGTVTQTVSISGNLVASEETNLDFAASGRVTAVDVSPGQSVTAGEALATIDTTSLQAAVTQAQANVSSAQAKLALDEDGTQVAQTQASVTSDQSTLNSDQATLSSA